MTLQFFNHVSLRDTGIMMRDSSSLRSIALITLFFLPVTTVATICGSEFFYYSSENEKRTQSIHMDPAAWNMFIVSGIVTVILMGAWTLQLKRLERQFYRGRTAQPRATKKGPIPV